jgi:hypothetical protein
MSSAETLRRTHVVMRGQMRPIPAGPTRGEVPPGADFAGNYNGVSAGVALVYGASSGVLENHSGVVIRLHAKTTGAELKLAGDAFEVKLP